MSISTQGFLKRLGSGESIEAICRSAGIDRLQFDRWWQTTVESRLPSVEGAIAGDVSAAVAIQRDARGIPHVLAEDDRDLFFGFGVAVAQDRLFQLDYLRRRASGRLAEVLGESALPLDLTAHIVGLPRIAKSEWDRLEDRVQRLVEAFSAGVNRVIEGARDALPVEFDLLDYRPEPWRPVDCLAIESEFRWYLTGRLPVIAIPELAKRTLGEGALYEDFLLGEADQESVLHAGDFDPAANASASEPVGHVMNDPDAAIGSNNWVLAGARTTTGLPLLASDPHIAFEAVSCWYQVHLRGGSFNVAGMAYAGIPAVMFGRNERVAWGITNNICSQRDLYQERVDEAHPGCFEFDGQWEPERRDAVTIKVRDKDTVDKTIRFSRNGPIVDELLPEPARNTGPVSLKWLGAHQGGWLTAMLDMDRADDVAAFRAALEPWHVPTFALVMADVHGAVAMQTTGRIPIRRRLERGYRKGWDPEDQWQGLIPFTAMPAVENPPRDWIASANNRLAPDNYPYKLHGCWSSCWRALRIRQMIESSEEHSFEDMRAMQQDVVSLRATTLLPSLLDAIEDGRSKSGQHPHLEQALAILGAWDGQCLPDSSAATIFNVFFTRWCETVARQRFEGSTIQLASGAISGLAGRLLDDDPHSWFEGEDRQRHIVASLADALELLSSKLGPDVSQWTWERLHLMPLQHVLSDRGDLGQLLDHGGVGVRGDMVTVCNSGSGPEWAATTGAGYRHVADLSSDPPSLWTVDGQSQSGHPASSHYDDQLETWLAGAYHELSLGELSNDAIRSRLVIQPGSAT